MSVQQSKSGRSSMESVYSLLGEQNSQIKYQKLQHILFSSPRQIQCLIIVEQIPRSNSIIINDIMVLKWAVLLLLILPKLSVTANQIIFLDETTFASAKSQFQSLLVFFYDETCQQCKSTAELYFTLIALCSQQQHTQENPNISAYSLSKYVQFAQINYQNHQQIFEKQGVEAVPEFILYMKGIQKPYRFTLISLRYENLWMMANWIKRVTEKHFPTFQNFNALNQTKQGCGKYVVIDCKQVELMQKIKQSEEFLINLDINYICLENSQLRNGNILLKENDYILKLADCIDDEPNQETLWLQCQNIIRNFRFRGIVHWSDDMIDNLFNKNYSLLVAITSNQTVSHHYIRELTRIRNNFQLKQKKTKQVHLPIFTVADIHYDLQGTTRIKKFIGGFDLKGWPYPFPLLAYLWCNQKGEIVKYIYQQKYNDSLASSIPISQWVQKAIAHNLTPHYRGLNASKQIQLLESADQRSVYKIFLSELLEIIQKHKNPTLAQKKPIVLLYIAWRSSWEMQLICSRIKKWWGSVNYEALFYNFDLVDNDLPPGVMVEQLPAFVVYYSDGSFSVSEGIQSEEQIKGIVGEVFKGVKASK